MQFESRKMKIKFRIILCVVLLLASQTMIRAEETANSRQARRIFNSAYLQVFGEQGATMRYDVNITGIYKTYGTIWYKGKKSKFVDGKMKSWNDGTTVYTIKKRKKEVEIHSAKNNRSDKYSQKFKFDPDHYDYSVANHQDGLMLTLRVKKGMKGMKEIHALVERKTYRPIKLRIKVAFIWTTVRISNFQSGDIDDDMLRFPREEYKDYTFVDKR